MRTIKKSNQTLAMRKYFNLRFEIMSQTFVGELKEGMIATTM